MANPKNETKTNTQANETGTVEVLYQKMGDRWFAFSLVGEDVFVGSITQDEINSAEKMKARPKNEPLHKVSGNS